MAYSEKLAGRVRAELTGQRDVAEKKMFGGVAFMLGGNMCCGVDKEDLIVRIDPADTEAALAQPHARMFDITGRPMRGWVMVAPMGTRSAAALSRWVGMSVRYAGSLPVKKR